MRVLLRDHPRLCGEKVKICLFGNDSSGSPPPMRGKEVVHDQKDLYGGITPAYAGKRGNQAYTRSKPEDHPRLCGEKISSLDKAFGLLGSPPPMRGKVLWSGGVCCPPGITPAYAGKS